MTCEAAWNAGVIIISMKPIYDFAILTVVLSIKYDIGKPEDLSKSP